MENPIARYCSSVALSPVKQCTTDFAQISGCFLNRLIKSPDALRSCRKSGLFSFSAMTICFSRHLIWFSFVENIRSKSSPHSPIATILLFSAAIFSIKSKSSFLALSALCGWIPAVPNTLCSFTKLLIFLFSFVSVPVRIQQTPSFSASSIIFPGSGYCLQNKFNPIS